MCELGEKIAEADQMLLGLVPLSLLYLNRGEPIRGLELGRRCLELAEATQDAGRLADARWAVGFLSLFCGKIGDAIANFEAGLRLLDRTNLHVSPRGFLYKSVLESVLAMALQLLGRVDEAAKLAEHGLRYARESKHLFSLGQALVVGGQRLACQREPEMVRLYTEEAVALSEEYGFAMWLAMGRLYHGWAVAELGLLEQGVAEMEEAVTRYRWQGGVRQQWAITLLAQGYARMGRTEEALARMNGALAHIERSGERIDQAEMLRLKGELLLMRDGGAIAEAEGCFTRQ